MCLSSTMFAGNRIKTIGPVLVSIAAIGAALGIWAVNRDEVPGVGTGPSIRVELLKQAHPRPSCPNAPTAPRTRPGQKLITVLRIVNHCLAYRQQAVPADQVNHRLAELRADPGVVAADVPTRPEPTDPLPPLGPDSPVDQWALKDLHGDQVRKLWPANADVKVAIIDTGIDDTNPDLAGQVVDKAPWARLYRSGDGKHGTHVAGIVAAKDDGMRVTGLTPGARLINDQYKYGDDWAGPLKDTGEYIRWAVDHGADVLNMSFGDRDFSSTEEAGLIYAEQSGVIAVSAAGNCGEKDSANLKINKCRERNELRYPAAYDATVLSVANYAANHKRGSGSSFNSSVDLAAPGQSIESTCLMPNQPTCNESGTSMAAPYVSATAALLKARHPKATPAAIREAIVRSTRPAPGQQAGIRSDEFGTGLLDPVAAADYLDKHPTTAPPTGSEVSPDTIVTGYVAADRSVKLATAGGSTIPVEGMQPGDTAPRIAFSRDGAWFAAADGQHLTFVDVESRRQETVDCFSDQQEPPPTPTCLGVAFNDKGQVLTANDDANVLATYEPATASRLHGVRVNNTSGTGLPTFMSWQVEGASGSVTVIGARFASAGYGAFGVRPDGGTFLIGRGGGDPGVRKIAVSTDGRWVAWGTEGVCGTDSEFGLADMSHPGSSASITGPALESEALTIRFAGDRLNIGWAHMQQQNGTCSFSTDTPWPPVQQTTPRPAMGTGTFDSPATGHWSKAADSRDIVERAPSGELLYTQPTTTAGQYELWFGPAPGGKSPIQFTSTATDVVGRPL